MWYKKRKMVASNYEQQQNSHMDDLSHQLCFVHRLAELPLVSASVVQFFTYYDKIKKSNRIFGASLHLAENGAKYAAKKVEPVRRLLDSPIVAANKFGCNQLEKFKEKYPAIQITPIELFKNGKVYYDSSYMKGAVEKAQAVVAFGQNHVLQTAIETYNNSMVKTGVDKVHAIVTYGPKKVADTGKIYYNAYFKPGVEQFYTIVAFLPQKPDMAVLVLTQNFVTTVATVTDYVDKHILTYMPQLLHKNVVVVVEYVNDLSEAFNKAENLPELRDKILNEAKNKAVLFVTVVASVMDRVFVYPPMSWLAIDFLDELIFEEIDFFDRESRRPLSLERFLAFGLPLLETREVFYARFG